MTTASTSTATGRRRAARRPPALVDIATLSDSTLVREATAAGLLGYSAKTLRNRRAAGRPLVPTVRLEGGGVRYRVGDLRAAMRAAQSTTHAE